MSLATSGWPERFYKAMHVSRNSERMINILKIGIFQTLNVKVIVAQSCPTLCNSMDGSLPGSSVHGILQARILEWLAIPFSRRSSVGSQIVSSFLQPHGLYSTWNSLDQNTGVCSHCLLQGIFPTQGLDTGLLHCGQILYQLSHQGSPISFIMFWIYLWKPQCSRCMVPTAMAVDKGIHEKHGE